MSYYADRSARDPAWRKEQLRAAAERERARRAADPVAFRRTRRKATARCRARQRATGLTFAELRRGTVEFHSTSRTFTLNGTLDAETLVAFRRLT